MKKEREIGLHKSWGDRSRGSILLIEAANRNGGHQHEDSSQKELLMMAALAASDQKDDGARIDYNYNSQISEPDSILDKTPVKM